MNKQDLEPHHGIHKEGGPAGGHGRVGGGDRRIADEQAVGCVVGKTEKKTQSRIYYHI